ncbi:EpsG family protein [Prevotella sp. MA2016]|uniref:EpsG family protein n=1 Tax=Prevotella sp. MA2016 TaxID=1408310 RepID=UPI00048E13E2|nr:EpsG family protein [Prevotella sp. MA2016]
MFIFLAVLAATIVICFLSEKKQRVGVIVLGGIMMLLCGLRANTVGADTDGYFRFADFATSEESSERFGILYLSLRLLCGIFDNPQVFIFVIALLTFVPLLWLIIKKSPLPAVSLLVFMVASSHYYLECFNIIRQLLSVVFVYLFIYYYFQKKYLWACCFLILAFLAHKFAFFVILVLPFLRRRIPFPVILCLITISVILGYIGTLDFLTEFLVGLSSYGSESAYNVASLGNYVNIHELNSKWSAAEVLSHWFPVTVVCIFGYRKSKASNLYNMLYNMLFVGAIITNLLMSNVYCDRIASYFTVSQIFIVANCLSKGLTISKVAITFVIFFYVLFYMYTLYIQNLDIDFVDNVMPYKFCFEK